MNATDAPIGIRYGMPFAEYLAVDAVSSSALRTFARSPWHYRNRVDISPTLPMLRGTLAHCAVLEPDAIASRYVVMPEDAPRRPTRAQWDAKKPSAESQAAMDWWRAFNESAAGRELVPHDAYAICQAQLEAVAANRTLSDILARGNGEVSIFWIDEATGLYCKARPDWLNDSGPDIDALDLKTCADESPGAFGRSAARLRYDLQAAHYIAGIKAVTGRRVNFVFGAVTSKPPILAVPYVLTDELAEQGEDERRELLDRLAWCQRENEWPAYGDGLQLLDFPAYAKRSGEVEVEWSEE